jgi:hypothetical protein
MFQESLSLPLRHIDQELLVVSRLLGQPLSLDSQNAEGKTIQLAYNPAMTRNDLSASVMKTFSPGSAVVSIDGDGKNVVRTLRINNDTRDLWMGRAKEGGGFAEKSSITRLPEWLGHCPDAVQAALSVDSNGEPVINMVLNSTGMASVSRPTQREHLLALYQKPINQVQPWVQYRCSTKGNAICSDDESGPKARRQIDEDTLQTITQPQKFALSKKPRLGSLTLWPSPRTPSTDSRQWLPTVGLSAAPCDLASPTHSPHSFEVTAPFIATRWASPPATIASITDLSHCDHYKTGLSRTGGQRINRKSGSGWLTLWEMFGTPTVNQGPQKSARQSFRASHRRQVSGKKLQDQGTWG